MMETHFMESMWRDLPTSVVEIVFTFLPIASLCRFRTLSKKWNRFISSSTFKQNAGAGSEEYVLITPGASLERGWDVLDVARKRYFTMSHTFLTEHMQGLVDAAIVRRPVDWGPQLYPVATDGGLFCVRFIFTQETSCLLVCNPVLKSVKQLPHAAGTCKGDIYETVVMATDRSSMEYEILIVSYTAYHMPQSEQCKPESILVYESKAGRWKTAPYQPSSYLIWWSSLTIFNNNYYCIVNTEDPSRNGLVCYDKETGVVSDLHGIDFPSALGSHLVASNARLFCVISQGPSAGIFEIDVVERVSTQLTTMSRALFRWILGDNLKREPDTLWYLPDWMIRIAVGTRDYILVATTLGRCAAYSLSQKSWYQFPDDCTLLEAHCRDETPGQFYGSNCCLSLCSP